MCSTILLHTEDTIRENKIQQIKVYNVDETGITIVQYKGQKIVAMK